MPQLDVTTWPPQLIWLAITFLALYYIVSRMIIPRTGGVIHERKAKVENDLAAAQKLKAETDRAIKAYEAALAEARQKANAIAAENRERLGMEIDAKRAEAEAALSASIAKSEKAIATSKEKALADVKSMASEIVSDIVTMLTGNKPSSADVADAVAKSAGK